LRYLQEALLDENPEMYENGIRIMGYLIDNQKIGAADKLQPYSSLAAIKSLSNIRKNEQIDGFSSRHYGSLVVLDFLVELGLGWTQKMVRTAEKYATISILIQYVKNQEKKLWQKRKSLRILKNMFENIESDLLPEVAIDAIDIFLQNIDDSDPFININATEALSLLSSSPRAQVKLIVISFLLETKPQSLKAS